jgi:hypothetical protein
VSKPFLSCRNRRSARSPPPFSTRAPLCYGSHSRALDGQYQFLELITESSIYPWRMAIMEASNGDAETA